MRIPLVDIQVQNEEIAEELRAAIDTVISQGQFILGPAVEEFERDFAEYIGCRHCVGLNSGTSALHLALLSLGVGPEHEVITTPHTWISTAWAISYVGARPVFVDIDPQTWNLRADLVERAITPRTKAILPVHLYGQAADVIELQRLADKHGLSLVEDAAQAHGARRNGKRIGSFGDIGCFSFYPGKNLGAFGEAGAIVTDNSELAARIRRLRDHAQQSRHLHTEIGFNARMEGLQGAVLGVKLRHLDRWNQLRQSHANHYRTALSDVSRLQLPACPYADAHVWHQFVVLVRSRDREEFRAKLAELGIGTGVHYPTPVPFQPAYQYLGYSRGDFPVAEDVMRSCVSLPIYPQLSSLQIDSVAEAVKHVLN